MATEWLDDNTANRHKQTYVKGFVDISGGDLILRNGQQQFLDNSYNYSTTDISDNSITSTIEITTNPVWNQVGNALSSDDYLGFCAMEASGNIIAYTERTSASNNYAHVYQYSDVSNEFQKLGSSIQQSDGNNLIHTMKLNAVGNRILFACHSVTDPVTGGSGAVEVYEYNTTVSGDWAQVGSTVYGETDGNHTGEGLGQAGFHASAFNTKGDIYGIGSLNYGTTTSEGNNTGFQLGRVKVYAYRDGTDSDWTKIGDFIGQNTYTGAMGYLALNDAGTILATGEGTDGNDNVPGTVRVYEYEGDLSWNQLGGDIKGGTNNDNFGRGLSFNSSGSIMAVGGPTQSTSTTHEGYVRVFEYKTISEEEYNNGDTSSTTGNVSLGGGTPIIVTNGESWSATTKFWVQLGGDIIGRETDDYFGGVVDLNHDGTVLSIQASGGHTVNASDQEATDTGPVYVYQYINGDWKLLADTIEMTNPLSTTSSTGCMLNHDGTKVLTGQETHVRLFEISQITNYVSNPTYATTNRTGNYNIRLGDISNNNTALSITKNYTTVTHDISGTYSDSYTHYPLIGDFAEPDGGNFSSYTQCGITVSQDLGWNVGIVELDASGTRIVCNSTDYQAITAYEFTNFTWQQLGNTISTGASAYSVRLSGNGEYITTNFNGDTNASVYKYNVTTNTWDDYGTFGSGTPRYLGISYDGQTIIIGEQGDDTAASDAGRAQVYEYTGDGSDHNWAQVGGDIILTSNASDATGRSVAINKTGNIIAVGSAYYDGTGGTNSGMIALFKYNSGATTGTTLSGYYSHNDWEPLGTQIEGAYSDNYFGESIHLNDDGYTFVATGRGTGTLRHALVYRYSEGLNEWYQYGYGRAENNSNVYGESSRMLAISGDGEMVFVGDGNFGYGYARQYKVLNGKLEPVGPAIYSPDGSASGGYGLVSMSRDGKKVAVGSYEDHLFNVYQLNDVQQTITAHTYKNTETETQDYIQLGNKTSGNMLEIKGTSEITGDMTINSTGTYQYIDISHVPQSIVLMDENEVYHTDVSYNGALSGYYCVALSSVYNTSYDAHTSFLSLIGNDIKSSIYRATSSQGTYDSSTGTYVGSVITSYKESKTDTTYTDLSGEYLQIEFPFMIKPNEFNYMIDRIVHTHTVGSVYVDISYGMLVGWDGTEWLKLTAIEQSDYNLYGVTKFDLSSNTHYVNKLRIIAHSGEPFNHVAFGAPYISGTVRTGTVPSMAVTSTDTDIKFNVTDLSMAGNLTIEANTFTLKNKDLNTDSDVNLIKYFPQAVGGNYGMATATNGDDHFFSSGNGAGLWMANVIHHTGSNSHFNGGYLFEVSNVYDTNQHWCGCNPFLYLTSNSRTFNARHFIEESYTNGAAAYGWLTHDNKYDGTTGAYISANSTTFVDMNGNTHNVGGEYLELHTPLPMKYKKFHYYASSNYGGIQKVMFVGKKNDIYYQLSYPQTLQENTFYKSLNLDRTDIFVSSIRIIILEAYSSPSLRGYITQLSFDAIPSIDTHLEITNNQFGTVFNAYDKGAKGNIIFNEAPHFNKGYLEYENETSLGTNNAEAVNKLLSNPTGYVGIGTNQPSAPLTVYGFAGKSSRTDQTYPPLFYWQTASIGNNQYFNSPYSTGNVTRTTGLYSQSDIRTMSSLHTHGGILVASDERIKTNVKDIDDGVALDTLRILKPKTYEYINKINRNEKEYVYGFMAQDVSAVLPYSVTLEREYVPNIYELADISNGSIVLTRNTTDAFTRVPELDGSGNAVQDASGNTVYRVKNKTLKCMNARGDDFEVTINEIIDDRRFTVKESITLEQKTHVDASGNVLKNRLFVLGEVVDDFHTLKKDAIWTISTAALQQVDRELQEKKEKTTQLETQVAALLSDVEALKNNTA